MTPMTEYLTLEDLLALIGDLGVGPVRDLGLLESAAHRPTTALWGRDVYATIEKKAAALLDSLVRDRPLADGNKRLDGSPHSFSWTSTAAGSRSPTTRPTNW